MSETTLERETWGEPTREFTHNDFQVRLFDFEPEQDYERTVVEWRWPNQSSEAAVAAIFGDLPRSITDPAERELILSASPFGDIIRFRKLDDFPPIFKALGYGFHERTFPDGDTTVTQLGLRYPTVPRLNQFMQAAFPEGDGIHFAEYDGGNYEPVEFIQALVDDGEILIAKRQPFKLHERAAFHEFGSIGFGGRFLRRLRSDLRPYLARCLAETNLPAIPELDDIRMQRFFTPAKRVMVALMGNLDSFTTTLAEGVIETSHQESPIGMALPEGVRNELYSLFSLSGDHIPIPRIAGDGMDKRRAFIELAERFEKANDYARSQLAA